MTNIKSIEIRGKNALRGCLFLSWDDANEHVRRIARTTPPLRTGPNTFRATVEWADSVKMSHTFDIDAGHAADPVPLSTELYDGLYASVGYDFGPTHVEGRA